MAGKGPPPKPAAQRRRRNATPKPTKLTAPPPAPAAERPRLIGPYSARTMAWYETWATSPQAEQFIATDWQRLQMLAPLVEDYFELPTKDKFTEIRLNEALFGATEADRLRLHWEIERNAEGVGAKPPSPSSPTRGTRRRADILKLIDGEATG